MITRIIRKDQDLSNIAIEGVNLQPYGNDYFVVLRAKNANGDVLEDVFQTIDTTQTPNPWFNKESTTYTLTSTGAGRICLLYTSPSPRDS